MIPSHRLEGHDFNNLSSIELSDAVHSMTQRAEAVTTLLESEFVNDKDGRLNKELIFQALASVRMEVIDIRMTVNKFHEIQYEQWQKENQK